MPYNTLKHGRAEYNSYTQIPSGIYSSIVQGADALTSSDEKNEKFAHLVYDVNSVASTTMLSSTTLVNDTYSRIIKTVSGNTYIMHAPPGSLSGNAVWRMQKIDAEGSRFWADGNINFDNAASGYLTHIYTL